MPRFFSLVKLIHSGVESSGIISKDRIMLKQPSVSNIGTNIDHWQERVDLAASFRWAEHLNMHEGDANHFSLAVNDDGTQFLMNPK